MNEIYTVQEASQRMKVTEQTVRRYIKTGKLKASKVCGRLWRIKQADLDEFVNGVGK